MTTPTPPVVDNLPDDPQKSDGAKVFNQKAPIWTAALDTFTTQINSLAAWMMTYFGDVVAAKQDTLVSGTNLKTINGESILGAGNLDVSGGGGSTTWNSSAGFTLTTYSLISDGSDYPDSFFSGNTSYKFESNNDIGGFCYFELAISQLGAPGDYELLLPINISPAQGSIISQILDSSGSQIGYMTWTYLENPFLHITESSTSLTMVSLFFNCYFY